MNETLAVVISSVIISLLLGLPIGILVSTSKLANRLLRPLLDAMQTMPTFVYMIPQSCCSVPARCLQFLLR